MIGKIGAWYGGKRHWHQLKEVDGFIYRFTDGHYCTDCAFMRYREKKTGKTVEELSEQLELQF